MRPSIAVTALLGSTLLGMPSVAHASGSDVIQVRGRTFRGTVVESRPGVLVRIRLDDGAEVTAPWSEVVTIDDQPLPPATAAKPAPKPAVTDLPRHWYGWQTILVDAGSLLMFLGGAASQSGTLAAFSGVTYAVGPPIVHAVHGRAGEALGSVLLRVGLPFLLAVVGVGIGDAATPSNQSNNVFAAGPIVGALTGLVTGVLAAAAIDDAVLAWEPGPVSIPGKGTRASPSVVVVPKIALTGDAEHGHAGWVGIGGSF